MEITINCTDGVPIYQQIVSRTLCLMALGELRPNEELPSIRTLALNLKVARNTIVRAYEELHKMGVVRKRRGSGTFVSSVYIQSIDVERKRIIEQRIDALLVEAQQAKFTLDNIVELIYQRQSLIALKDSAKTTSDMK